MNDTDAVNITLSFTINGSEVTVDVPMSDRLLDVLRDRLGLTGTKEGCGEGECGACTVLLDGRPVNSCLVPCFQVQGRDVRTIESVDRATLSPLHESGATQCGACTPGVVMTSRWIGEDRSVLRGRTLRELMSGNLCRCTGYDGIIEGVRRTLDEEGED
ncbi:MAG: (2Fe-2S)-binding protein [Phycisphaerales bacterium]|nr:(2Fe-2S)-binding protein [Phycisphaerales bacterium]